MERRAIWIRGTVQGVGFRPFVYGLAGRLGLGGWVWNDTGGVRIEVEGQTEGLDQFLVQVTAEAPPLARIEQVSWEQQAVRGQREFRIRPSDCREPGLVVVTPDVATCRQCLDEMADPRDRRYQYPFLNCTNCGPRLTILTGAPYDRQRTTMASFVMCPQCRAEYEDPGNRRFHAQPTACPACGPRLTLLDAKGRAIQTDQPLERFAEALREGKIGAMKGLGGYHLVCDARNAAAVAELRRRKHRDEKPLAIMVPDLEAAERVCEVGELEGKLLVSPQRPIVLLGRRGPCSTGFQPVPGALEEGRSSLLQEHKTRAGSPCYERRSPCHGGGNVAVAEEVAPGNPCLGVMLPYTPLHHLLMGKLEGRCLVMTSGNRSDEPIAYRDEDAVQRLGGIADLFLVHNRPIHVRCDDSVTLVAGGQESPVRRSRGYAPQPLGLPLDCPQAILAVGGQLKGVFALGQERRAVLSHHMGDLDHYEAFEAFQRDILLYQELFAVQPRWMAHDLHPDYLSTRYALRRQTQEGLGCLAIQHHHAHMASCMAEHGLCEEVIGVSFDGTGFGTDGAVWGGEFLVGDYGQFWRAGHLRYVGMPGGEQAIRQPWRMAAAHVLDALDATALSELLGGRVPTEQLSVVRKMLERRLNTPATSSAGRLFDAVASLAGVRDRVSYEGQAAMQLEWLARGEQPAGTYPFEIRAETGEASGTDGVQLDDGGTRMGGRGSRRAVIAGETAARQEPRPPMSERAPRPLVVDTRPLIRAVAGDVREGVRGAVIARRFHTTMVDVIVAMCGRVRQETGIAAVVLSGGVFMNTLLVSETEQRLRGEGFRVYRHRLVPPNDGGLCLGQLAIAARWLETAEAKRRDYVSWDSRQSAEDVPRA